MRILLASPTIPRRDGSAAHVVLNELIEALHRLGHQVILQPIFTGRSSLTGVEEARVHQLTSDGVQVLSSMFAPGSSRWVWTRRLRLLCRLRRALFTIVSDFYPTVALRDEFARRVARTASDVVLIFWDPEGLAATYGLRGVRRAAYYGMPDYMAGEARLIHPQLFDIPHGTFSEAVRLRLARRLYAKRRAIHFQLMRDCDAVGNICAFHADLYRAMGHPQSVYIPNMWPDTPRVGWRTERLAAERGKRAKLLGSLGNVAATGNTFGLHYLGTQILPRLERRLGVNAFEVHIYGHGNPYSLVARSLARSSVKFRGWVEDLDAEILSSNVFLMMNNTGYYKGSHSRFLHAWTLGACVVAHAINGRAMPEIRHMENALLGEDPDEIADLIVLALKDNRLRQRIGAGGRQTYESYFRPEIVVPRLVEQLLVGPKFTV